MPNIDQQTADGFDRIWDRHGASPDPSDSGQQAFAAFFGIFPLDIMGDAEGFDLGCGNGRIARHVAPHVGLLHCIDQSAAGVAAARSATAKSSNVRFHQASVDAIPLPDESQDFGYSLGVLHHIPDPEAGLRACVAKLKPGAPFLLYLYYALDDRPAWFRAIWRASDVARRAVSRMPFRLRVAASDAAAALLYWPLSRAARVGERLGLPVEGLPLSAYRKYDWATLRADSLDRFGTAVEHRFSKADIEAMMRRCGLGNIRFAPGPPYWVALGTKE